MLSPSLHGEPSTFGRVKMNSIVSQITQARDALRQHHPLIPDDLSPWNLPGVSKTDIENAFNRILFLASAFTPKSQEAASLMRVSAAPRLTTISQAIAGFPQNPAAYTINIFTQLSALAEQFTGATTFEGRTEIKRASKKMLDDIAVVNADLTRAAALYSELRASHTEYRTNLQQVAESKSALANTAEQAAKDAEVVIQASAEAIQALAGLKEKTARAQELHHQFSDLVSESKDLKGHLEEITSLNQKQQKTIQNNLEDSNRVGLAASFNKRKEDLLVPLSVWGTLLVSSLAGIALLGAFFILPEIKAADWATFLFKLPITAPFIWLAWFSGIQYRQLSNIREDYAFKNATAMAFAGYSKEAAIDPALTKELLQKSIETFSQNPLRLFENDKTKDTPLADLTEKLTRLVEKIVPELLKRIPER